MSLLLAAGADPFQGNREGRTAMDLATLSGNLEMMQLLETVSLVQGNVNLRVRGAGAKGDGQREGERGYFTRL